MSNQSTQPGHAAAHQEPKSLCKRLLKFLFGHVGLFLLVAAVAVLGAIAFMKLEEDNETHRYLLKRNKARDLQDAYNYISSYLWHYQITPNLTFPQWDNKVKKNLKTLEEFITDAVNTYKYDGTVDGWNYDWTLTKALLFTISIMTTIGYGHIFPRTLSGQVFTIVYAMVGTPLLLVFLANIGSGMSHTFTYIYSRVCCRWCRTSRYQNEACPGKRTKRLMDDIVGKEEYMPTDEVQVPIVINMILISLTLVLGAVIFSNWEDWSFSSACYFSFVTLTTIGFGDMVPGNSFLDSSDMAAFKMGVTVAYCLFGMALISMCIQMMQDQIVTKVRWAAEEIGIMESKGAQRRVVRLKRSRRGKVMETASDADGSRPLTVTREQKRRSKQRRQERAREEREREEQQREKREQRARGEKERERKEREKERPEREQKEREEGERKKREEKAEREREEREDAEKAQQKEDEDDDLFDLA